MSLTDQRQVRCTVTTPYRDSTTHVVFEPLDFIPRLAVLVPDQSLPRTNAVAKGQGSA